MLALTPNELQRAIESLGFHVHVCAQPTKVLASINVRTVETPDYLYVLFPLKTQAQVLIRTGEKGSREKVRLYWNGSELKTETVE